MNSFNPKGMDIDKNLDNLVNTANKFNSGSIGIKCSIIEANGIILVVFSIEEISINEKMLNISSESLRTIAAILSGAPALFEKLGKAKSKE
ncbi:hypothetical protein I5P64_05710 [Serratia ureilytica]|nr:hypothetical protein [Serratia ureilytica]